MTALRIRGTLTILNHRLPGVMVPSSHFADLHQKGVITRMHSGGNLITDAGLQAFAALLGGGFNAPSVGAQAYSPDLVCRGDQTPPVGTFAQSMQVGTYPTPAAPTPVDVDLQGEAAYIGYLEEPATTMVVTYPAVGAVEFTTLIDPGVLDGEIFTEEGLFSADGVLLARRLIEPAWEKPIGQATQFVHRIQFARS